MAISIDWITKIFSIPQADLTFVSGTLYEMDTQTYLRAGINTIMASEEGIVFEDALDHNVDYTVAGVNYARKIEMINGYSIQFTPDAQWSVRLVGSNNNLFDIENGILQQNQVQVIPSNSAGLVIVSTGTDIVVSALVAQKIDELFRWLGLKKGTTVRHTPGSIVVEEGESPNEISQTLTGDGENETIVSRD